MSVSNVTLHNSNLVTGTFTVTLNCDSKTAVNALNGLFTRTNETAVPREDGEPRFTEDEAINDNIDRVPDEMQREGIQHESNRSAKPQRKRNRKRRVIDVVTRTNELSSTVAKRSKNQNGNEKEGEAPEGIQHETLRCKETMSKMEKALSNKGKNLLSDYKRE